jgi:hypothetical protein
MSSAGQEQGLSHSRRMVVVLGLILLRRSTAVRGQECRSHQRWLIRLLAFKISTSGDAIDVDCVQNEAGAVATSPIVTTTATVTRNADSLTYQTAGNIDFAVGTAYCEALLYGSSLTRIRAIRVGADGWSYINA